MMTENEIGSIVVDASVEIHRRLGPGLLESVYQKVLTYELGKRGLKVCREVSIPIAYDGVIFDDGFRADLIVEDRLILELKSVEKVLPVHKKQLLTYLKLAERQLGYLLNFGEELMKGGITRVVNGLKE